MTPRKPRGHPPTPEPDGWPKLLASILKRTELRNGPSLRGLAAHCGVSHATVNRWIKGGAFPSAERVQAIREWLEL